MSDGDGAPGERGFDFQRTGGVRFSSSSEGGVPSEFFKMFNMGGMGGDGFESLFEESGMGGMGGKKGKRTQKFKFTSKAR
jgi:hypothetical protein